MNRDNPRTKIKKRQQIPRAFLFSDFIDKPIPHSVPKYNNPQIPESFSYLVLNDTKNDQIDDIKNDIPLSSLSMELSYGVGVFLTSFQGRCAVAVKSFSQFSHYTISLPNRIWSHCSSTDFDIYTALEKLASLELWRWGVRCGRKKITLCIICRGYWRRSLRGILIVLKKVFNVKYCQGFDIYW